MSFVTHLYQYDELPSTNDEAKRLAESGASEGTAILAARQSAGRGRRGREWVSPEGNLYLSLVLRPPRSIQEAASLGFLAQLALSDWLGVLLPAPHLVHHKWPNDLLLNGKKISGLLLESSGNEKIDWLVLGLGFNLRHHPKAALYPATDLFAESGLLIEPEAAANDFITLFKTLYEGWQEKGFTPYSSPWLERASGLGKAIRVNYEKESIEGIFLGIDGKGYLQLELPDGSVQKIGAADIFPVREEKHDAAGH